MRPFGDFKRTLPTRENQTEIEAKKYKLAVTKESQGCKGQHREYSQ